MSENHKATLAKANAAIVQGDFERLLQFCTEDTKWTFVGDRTLSGKQAVRQCRQFLSASQRSHVTRNGTRSYLATELGRALRN
jgi:ketosteroid isomerase-like protein